jgi:hypothetical protein
MFGEGRRKKGERRTEKGERRMEKGEGRMEKGGKKKASNFLKAFCFCDSVRIQT